MLPPEPAEGSVEELKIQQSSLQDFCSPHPPLSLSFFMVSLSPHHRPTLSPPPLFDTSFSMGWNHLEIAIKLDFWYK
jgi:hypothetical protein